MQARRYRRFFSENPLPDVGQRVFLSLRETHHLRDSLRLKAGDACLLVDSEGHQAEARLVEFSEEGQACLEIEKEVKASSPETSLALRLFVACPQRGKMDFLIEKAQELSVLEIWPLETSRTVLKMKEPGRTRALERWKKIAQEAMKQSGASVLTQVGVPISFEDAWRKISKDEEILFFHPDRDAIPFKEYVKRLHPSLGTLNLFFGPEGGFSDEEVKKAYDEGAERIGLGETILKVDTAVLGVVAALRFLCP